MIYDYRMGRSVFCDFIQFNRMIYKLSLLFHLLDNLGAHSIRDADRIISESTNGGTEVGKVGCAGLWGKGRQRTAFLKNG